MNLRKCLLTKNECYQRGVKINPVGVMVHSTGANNPWLKRYVQPDDGLLGTNNNGNHWNRYRPDGRQVCVHALIGKLADGGIATYQTLPWNYRGWHSGYGSKGSANNMGYIGFEICEDGLNDGAYFAKVYREAVELAAYLCKMFGFNPLADGKVICHSEGHKRGIASNHADVMHWFPKHGKSMDTFRADVAAEMNKTTTEEDEDVDINKLLQDMTDEQAYLIYQKAVQHMVTLPEPEWSQKEGAWKKAQETGVMDGTSPERPLKRDEFAAVLDRKGLL